MSDMDEFDARMHGYVTQLQSDRDMAIRALSGGSEVAEARAEGEARAFQLALSHLHSATQGRYGQPLGEQPDWRRVPLGQFGGLRSESMRFSSTIAEHVRDRFDGEAMEGLDEETLIAVFRRQLKHVMIQYGIVLDGDDLYCAEHGLDLWHGSIDDARKDAALAAGYASTHFFGALADEFTQRGPQGVCELFERWRMS